MADSHTFSQADIDNFRKQPFIDDVGAFLGNAFMVKANGGSTLPFTADIFLEAVDDKFIDTLPPTFDWAPGSNVLPVIISSDYLELYNTAFAPGGDLPQFSSETISSLLIGVECTGNGLQQNFRANIVATSDRINSVIVPMSFLQWANEHFANTPAMAPSKILVKTKDANDPQFLSFIEKSGCHINRDKTRFGRIKTVLQVIVSGLAGFGVLVILLAMVLFSFYLQLLIARSKENLQLLLTIGYSPQWLSKTVSRKWIPVYVSIILISLLITALLHLGFRNYVSTIVVDNEGLPPYIHWVVILVALLLLFLSVTINHRIVKRLLSKM